MTVCQRRQKNLLYMRDGSWSESALQIYLLYNIMILKRTQFNKSSFTLQNPMKTWNNLKGKDLRTKPSEPMSPIPVPTRFTFSIPIPYLLTCPKREVPADFTKAKKSMTQINDYYSLSIHLYKLAQTWILVRSITSITTRSQLIVKLLLLSNQLSNNAVPTLNLAPEDSL
jgi:hypothetical protein